MGRPERYKCYSAAGELVALLPARLVNDIISFGAGRIGPDNPGVVVMVDDMVVGIAQKADEPLALYVWKDSYLRPCFDN